jgi:2-C-methyl-D-erythritol 4-phosphate cytidylyltransferase
MMGSERDAGSNPVDLTVSALILAGGLGERMGGEPKAFLQTGGVTLLERVVDQARNHAGQVIVGLPGGRVGQGRSLLGDRAVVIPGGETRQGTFMNALDVSGGEIVVVHDVARPFASTTLWKAVISGARDHGAAAPAIAVPARDSLATRDGEWLGSPVDREGIVAIQTPYAFRRTVLDRALAAADGGSWAETSVTTLVTKSGQRVFLVAGEDANTKVTFAADWEDARLRMSEAQAEPTRAAKSSTREL